MGAWFRLSLFISHLWLTIICVIRQWKLFIYVYLKLKIMRPLFSPPTQRLSLWQNQICNYLTHRYFSPKLDIAASLKHLQEAFWDGKGLCFHFRKKERQSRCNGIDGLTALKWHPLISQTWKPVVQRELTVQRAIGQSIERECDSKWSPKSFKSSLISITTHLNSLLMHWSLEFDWITLAKKTGTGFF